jgi:hypothetical protein
MCSFHRLQAYFRAARESHYDVQATQTLTSEGTFDMSICPYCHAVASSSSRFCRFDGYKLLGPTAELVPPSSPIKTPELPSPLAHLRPAATTRIIRENPEVAADKPRRNGLAIAATCALCVAFVVGLALVASRVTAADADDREITTVEEQAPASSTEVTQTQSLAEDAEDRDDGRASEGTAAPAPAPAENAAAAPTARAEATPQPTPSTKAASSRPAPKQVAAAEPRRTVPVERPAANAKSASTTGKAGSQASAEKPKKADKKGTPKKGEIIHVGTIYY